MAAERRARRNAALPAAAIAVGLALAGGSAKGAADVVPVAVGNYEASPEVEEAGTYSKGLFAVVKKDGVRTIVPSEGFTSIFYPDDGRCDQPDQELLARRIDVSPTGRFKIWEKAPAGNGVVQVNWKGHWTKAKRVVGTITVKYDGCTSTSDWTGRRVAAVPAL